MTSKSPIDTSQPIHNARRRLSVVSDNKLVEGFESVGLNEKGEDNATETTKPTNSSSSGFVVNSYGGYSKKGYAPYNPKKKNQDALIMAEDPKTRSLVFCVMDGHGEAGDKVSQAIKSKFSKDLFEHKSFQDTSSNKNIIVALKDVIYKCEEEVLRDGEIETDFSGTTFTCVVIRDRSCITANVGDSRSIVGFKNKDNKITALSLTEDHKPDNPEEKKRIEASGGRVFAVEYEDGVDGPARVWLKHMDVPGLAMSRSLGDGVAHKAGVISEPDFTEYHFQDSESHEDLILVIASDGLWEFMSNQEVIDITANTDEPRYAVDRLIKEAHERWMNEEQVVDDTTVCVAFLGAFKTNSPKK